MIVNVRLPKELTAWMDSLVEQGVYGSKSEILRDVMRDYVEAKGGKQ